MNSESAGQLQLRCVLIPPYAMMLKNTPCCAETRGDPKITRGCKALLKHSAGKFSRVVTLTRRMVTSAAAKWIVAVGLLTSVVWSVPLREIGATFQAIKIMPLMVAVALSVLSQLLQAMRLGILARPLDLTWRFSEVLAIHFTSLAYRVVLPGGSITGTAVRLYKFSRRQNMAATGVMLLVDRLIATMTLGLVGLVCFFVVGLNGSIWLAVLFACVVMACAGGLLPIQTGLDRSSLLTPIMHRPLLGRIARKLKGTKALPLRTTVLTSALAFVVHALGVTLFLMVARSVGISLDFWEIGLARAVMLVAVLLPVSVAGLGLREGAAVMMLARMDQSQGAAVTFSLLVFVVVWLLPGLVGALLEILSFRR